MSGTMTRELAQRVLARDPSYDPRLRAAMILAVAGRGDQTEAIGRASERRVLTIR
jgi:hypothetical protein